MTNERRRAPGSAPATLPPLSLRAHNTASASENGIHDDEEARRLGLRGGLVPGVTLYAYLTQMLVPALGVPWLRRGTAAIRFRRPVYEGEEVTCTAGPTESRDGADGSGLELTVTGPDGAVCARGSTGLASPDEAGGGLTPAGFDAAPPPAPRPELTRETAPIGVRLAPRSVVFDPDAAAAYADETEDPNPFYRGGSPFGLPIVPPALLVSQPARLLRENFEYGPSVHTASEIAHLGLALAGGLYRVEGTLLETFERKGNDYLAAEVHIFDHQGAAVVRIRHTVIFRFAARS